VIQRVARSIARVAAGQLGLLELFKARFQTPEDWTTPGVAEVAALDRGVSTLLRFTLDRIELVDLLHQSERGLSGTTLERLHRASSRVADSPIKFQDSNFKKWQGSRGTVRWNRSAFEQLPATFHVVNGMADLQIVEYVSAEMVEFSGPRHRRVGNSVRVIEPAG